MPKPKDQIEKEKKHVIDWLAFELIKINTDATIISYPEALNLSLRDFFYILRSTNKYGQLKQESLEANANN